MSDPVLILGAGINGIAVARDLLLSGVPVLLVDKNDVAFGATSRSSRLIHGGVRYLEYGEFRLVSESLTERSHLLELAPQFVQPLELYIPVRTRFGGLLFSVFRFLSAYRIPLMGRLASKLSKNSERGVWLVRAGLKMYDWFARKSSAPKHTAVHLPHDSAPAIDPKRYRWACQYMDAQIRFPERFVIAMLHDCQRLAKENDVEFALHVHSVAEIENGTARVVHASGQTLATLKPKLVINATGAWGDSTLTGLKLNAKRMFGGTKGSHLISHKPQLREAIGDAGIYAEASDGRLIFILPFGDAVMVGTTDVRFEKDPGDAIASPDEISYLVDMVNRVLPGVALTRSDVNLHYSGVRPLPYRKAGSTAVISRDHSIKEHTFGGLQFLTLIGGKLTTCRGFAELVAKRVFEIVGGQHSKSTANLPYWGADDWPAEGSQGLVARLTTETEFSSDQVREVVQLCGSESQSILAASEDRTSIPDTNIPTACARWMVENEWCETLEDLVERRLMLVYARNFTRASLTKLAELFPDSPDDAVEKLILRLETNYGLVVGESK